MLAVLMVLSALALAQKADNSPMPALVSLVLSDAAAQAHQRQLDRAMAAGDFAAALTAAKALVQQLQADRRHGPVAISNLGLVQLRQGDSDGAIANFQLAIEQLKQSGNFRDPRLSSPLYGLGLAHYRLGAYPQAIDYIEQANFVTRTDKGLESLEQTAYDDLLLDSLSKMGRMDDALDRLESGLTIHRQALRGGPELEQALARAARWYRQFEAPYQESRLHEERLELLAAERGDSHPDLVPVYYDLAGSYSRRIHNDLDKLRDIKAAERNVSYSFVRSDQVRRAINNDFGQSADHRSLLDSEWKAVRALKVALRIQEDQSPQDLAALGETYVRLGDHYQLLGDRRKARRYYQRAYDLLREGGAEQRLVEAFAQPVPIYQKTLKMAQSSDPSMQKAYNGEIEFVMDVTSRGEPRNIEFLEARPEQAESLKDKALRYSRDTIFRPRYTEKGNEKAEQVRFVYRFRPSAEAP